MTLARLVRWALFLRVATVLLLHLTVSENAFAPDQATYHFFGAWLAHYWEGDTLVYPDKIDANPRAYYYIVASLYWLFGDYSLLPKLLNALVGTYAVKLAWDIALLASANAQVALRAAQLTAFFPSLILWSALNIRDCWVVVLILVMCRAGLELRERVTIPAVLCLGGSIVLISGFRDYLFLALAAPVVVSFVLGRGNNALRNALLGAVVAGGLIYFDRVSGADHSRLVDLDAIQETRNFTNFGTSRFQDAVDISTPAKALWFLPRGLVFFLLSPYPWDIRSARQAVTFPEMLFFYSLIPSIVVGFRHLLLAHGSKAMLLCLVTACLTLGYALGEANAGGAYRHRAQVLVLLLVFSAVGGELQRRRKEARDRAAAGLLPREI